MTVPGSLLVAVFCMALVFLVLACLCGLLKLFSLGIAAAAKQRPGPSAPASGAKVKSELSGSAETRVPSRAKGMRKVVVTVSDEAGTPLSKLRFQSIRAVKKPEEEDTP